MTKLYEEGTLVGVLLLFGYALMTMFIWNAFFARYAGFDVRYVDAMAFCVVVTIFQRPSMSAHRDFTSREMISMGVARHLGMWVFTGALFATDWALGVGS